MSKICGCNSRCCSVYGREDCIVSGIWNDGSKWYLAYECASEYADGSPGDVCLATSNDGVNFVKRTTPILKRNTAGWNKVNIGTPSLYKVGSKWYLFYHGFDGSKVKVGLATGSELTKLTPENNNQPIVSTGGSFDAGTVGKRSIIKQGSYYYMVYEASTEKCADFTCSKWTSALARSSNLITWTKYSKPLIPQTTSGFGYDLPEFVKTSDGKIFIYFRHPTGPTKRAQLKFN